MTQAGGGSGRTEHGSQIPGRGSTETGDCMADYYHMGAGVRYYHFDGSSFVKTADEYFYLVDFEIELYADSPEANKAIAEKHDSFINNSLSVDLVEVNSDNIAKYLGGNGTVYNK